MRNPIRVFRVATIVGFLFPGVSGVAQTAPTALPATPAPAAAGAELKDAEGRPLRRASTGHITNYYEDKVGAYTLPDPLVLRDGRPVRDATTWFDQRRPEILKLYETEIFGHVPATAPKVRWEVVEKNAPALGGAAMRQRIVGHFGGAPEGPAVNVMLYFPARAAGPVPLVLHITFGGDPLLAPSPAPVVAGAPSPKKSSDMGPVAEVLARGYAYAVLRYTEIQPDKAAGLTSGVIGQARGSDPAAPAADAWGTIGAWAWGLSRIMDYLETDPAIDAKRVALVGHSRLGKTVLWAGAADPRFALIFSSCAGEMGSALSRRDFGETVDDMAAGLSYQFAGNFKKYAGHWNEMPVDAHLLIALCAPRPVLVTAGSDDLWADPRGEFLALVAAGPVWRLLGQPDLGTTEMPALDRPVASGTLAYLEHTGPHAITSLDWETFFAFAGRYLRPRK